LFIRGAKRPLRRNTKWPFITMLLLSSIEKKQAIKSRNEPVVNRSFIPFIDEGEFLPLDA